MRGPSVVHGECELRQQRALVCLAHGVDVHRHRGPGSGHRGRGRRLVVRLAAMAEASAAATAVAAAAIASVHAARAGARRAVHRVVSLARNTPPFSLPTRLVRLHGWSGTAMKTAWTARSVDLPFRTPPLAAAASALVEDGEVRLRLGQGLDRRLTLSPSCPWRRCRRGPRAPPSR